MFSFGEQVRIPRVVLDRRFELAPFLVGNLVKRARSDDARLHVLRGYVVNGEAHAFGLLGELCLFALLTDAEEHEVEAILAVIAERNRAP